MMAKRGFLYQKKKKNDVMKIIKRFKDRLWRTVALIIVENPWIVKEARTVRELYYLVRNILAQIDRELYERFKTKEAYNYFTQDFLNRLEAWGVIDKKPPADPTGFFLIEGTEYAIEQIVNFENRLSNFKGIIYVEKRSAALRLAPLSEIGFIILAGKGFPTRLMREFAKKGRLFVYHDADKSGADIYRVFAEGAKRLKRISEDYAARWIVPHAKDIGLFVEDAIKLGVESEPEARGREGRRYELEALYAKLRSMGIENPHVAYVGYQLEKKYGVDLKPRIISPEEMYARKVNVLLSLLIDSKLSEIIRKKASEVISSVQLAGQQVLDGYRLRCDLLEQIAKESLVELSKILASETIEIKINPWDLTIIVGGIEGFVDENDFEKKFKEKYGINRMYELLG